MTNLERKVLEAARHWLCDRTPEDADEKALAVAVLKAFPEDAAGKEACDCGEQDSCDECATGAEIQAMIRRWEAETGASAVLEDKRG